MESGDHAGETLKKKKKSPYIPWSNQKSLELTTILVDAIKRDCRDRNGTMSKTTVEKQIRKKFRLICELSETVI